MNTHIIAAPNAIICMLISIPSLAVYALLAMEYITLKTIRPTPVRIKMAFLNPADNEIVLAQPQNLIKINIAASTSKKVTKSFPNKPAGLGAPSEANIANTYSPPSFKLSNYNFSTMLPFKQGNL